MHGLSFAVSFGYVHEAQPSSAEGQDVDVGVLGGGAGDGVVAARQQELVLEALGAKTGLAAQFDDLTFQPLGDLVGRVFGAAAAFDQSGRFAGLITAQPFADGVAETAELAGGGLDAVGTGEGNRMNRSNAVGRASPTISHFNSLPQKKPRWSQIATTSAGSNSHPSAPTPSPSRARSWPPTS